MVGGKRGLRLGFVLGLGTVFRHRGPEPLHEHRLLAGGGPLGRAVGSHLLRVNGLVPAVFFVHQTWDVPGVHQERGIRRLGALLDHFLGLARERRNHSLGFEWLGVEWIGRCLGDALIDKFNVFLSLPWGKLLQEGGPGPKVLDRHPSMDLSEDRRGLLRSEVVVRRPTSLSARSIMLHVSPSARRILAGCHTYQSKL